VVTGAVRDQGILKEVIMFKYKSVGNRLVSVILLVSMLISGLQPEAASAQGGTNSSTQTGGDGLKRQVNVETGMISFIGPESGRVVPASKVLGTSIRPQDPGMALINRFAPEFGIQNPGRDLSEIKKNGMDDGRMSIRYQQTYQGIRVLGGELIVNTNANGDLYSMNGEVSPDISIRTEPTIDSAQAAETAREAVAKWYQVSSSDLYSSEPELWIYDESLLQPSTRPVELVWRMDVTAKDNLLPVRELVLVNAERGSISLHFNQIDNAWADPSSKMPDTSQNNPPTTSILSNPVMPAVTANTMNEPVPSQNAVNNSAALAAAATWYVATTGDDTNDCLTTSTPCATINGAIGKAIDGDTILVASGTYTKFNTLWRMGCRVCHTEWHVHD